MAAKRSTPLASALEQATSAVGRALVGGAVRGMLIGGMAVIARGVPRTTRDVDATIDGNGVDLQELLTTLKGHALVPRIDDAAKFAAEHQVLLLRHAPSGIEAT